MIKRNTELIVEDGRKIREKLFHNEIFETKARRKLSIFYSIGESIREEFAELVSKYTSKRILEIGCAMGSYAISMSLKGAKVSAIDVSEYAINRAKERVENEKIDIRFIVMDAENLQFKDSEFNLVYGISILHHLNLIAVISEIERVLKIGGKAIFIEPMVHNPLIKIFRLLTPRLRSKDEHPLRMRDLQLISKKFSRYEVKHYYFLTLFALPFFKLPFYNKIRTSLERLDKKIFSFISPLKLFSWQVLLILEK